MRQKDRKDSYPVGQGVQENCFFLEHNGTETQKQKKKYWNIEQSQASLFSAQKQLLHCFPSKIKTAMQQQTLVRNKHDSEDIAPNPASHKERLQGTVRWYEDWPRCCPSGRLLLSPQWMFSVVRFIKMWSCSTSWNHIYTGELYMTMNYYCVVVLWLVSV